MSNANYKSKIPALIYIWVLGFLPLFLLGLKPWTNPLKSILKPSRIQFNQGYRNCFANASDNVAAYVCYAEVNVLEFLSFNSFAGRKDDSGQKMDKSLHLNQKPVVLRVWF